MEDGWMEVVNLEKLVNFSRKVIFYNFDEENAELKDSDFLDKIEKIENTPNAEMDKVLPYPECKLMLQSMTIKKKNKKTQETKYFLKEGDYDVFLSQLNQRMISNIVQGLVKKGILESAFDSEKNDFVFWIKHDEESEKPETD